MTGASPRLWASSWAVVTALHAATLAGALLWRPPDMSPGPASAPALMIDLAVPAALAKAANRPAPPVPVPVPPVAPPSHPVPPQQSMPSRPKLVSVPVAKPPSVLPASPTVPAATPAPSETVAPDPASASALPAQAASVSRDGASERPRMSSAASLASWQGRVMDGLQRHKRYPRPAQRLRQEGVATVSFVMGRDGRVISARLVSASGHVLLDKESLAVIDRAQPFPPPPADLMGDSVELVVPVRFFLQ
jgi:protein TonB